MKVFKLIFACSCLIVFLENHCYGMQSSDFTYELDSVAIQKNDGVWKVHNRTFSTTVYRNKPAFVLSAGSGAGIAYHEELVFQDGEIELDIAAVPYFTGVVFRLQSPDIYEAIYFRPQNSISSDPVTKSRSVQYISHPAYTWQKLRKEHPGKYESFVELAEDEWFHVKVKVKGSRAEVYVNYDKNPCLVIDSLLLGESKGSIGLWCGNTSGGTFSNFQANMYPPKVEQELGEPQGKYTENQEYLFDTFLNRRSVRNFLPTPIPENDIEKMLEIAASAPTAGNQQPWKFLVVNDSNMINALLRLQIETDIKNSRRSGRNTDADSFEDKITKKLKGYLSAPTIIVILTENNSKYPSYNIMDGTLAAGYLLIAARALGYGTVFTTDSFSKENISEAFGISSDYSQVCLIPVGIPERWPDSPPKKELSSFILGMESPSGLEDMSAFDDCISYKEFVGTYDYLGQLTMDVTCTENNLYLQSKGYEPIKLIHVAEHTFKLENIDSEVTFHKNNQGKLEKMIVKQEGTTYTATKVN